MATHRHSPGHNNLPPTTTGSIPAAINHNQQPPITSPEELAVRQALNNLPQLVDSVDQTVDRHMELARDAIRTEQMVGLESDARNSGFNKTISKAEGKIHKKQQKLEKLEQGGRLSKKKKANLEWDMLKQQQKIRTSESFKQNASDMVKRKYGLERQKDPLQLELTQELQNIDTAADQRQSIIDMAQNPNTESSVRIMMQNEIASWGGETIEDFVDRRNQEVRQAHQERLIKTQSAEKMKEFGNLYKELSKRIDITSEAQTTSDPAKRQQLLLQMGAWGESIAEFKKRNVSDDELDLFNNVVTISAERAFRKESAEVKGKVKKFNEVLVKEQGFRDRAKDVHAKILDLQKRITTETDQKIKSDLIQEHENLKAEYLDIQKDHKDIVRKLNGTNSRDQYEKQLMKPVAAKYLKAVQIVNL